VYLQVYRNVYTDRYLVTKEDRFEKAWNKLNSMGEDLKHIGQDLIKTIFKKK
jgi:hypothetical protein